jgi:hypothetical protein
MIFVSTLTDPILSGSLPRLRRTGRCLEVLGGRRTFVLVPPVGAFCVGALTAIGDIAGFSEGVYRRPSTG